MVRGSREMGRRVVTSDASSDIGRALGTAIGEARRHAGISQRELGRRVDADQAVVSSWEQGKRIPTIERVIALDDAFGLRHGTLLERARVVEPPSAVEMQARQVRFAIDGHLKVVEGWSSQIQFFGMTRPESTSATVPVTLTSLPRKFREPGAGLATQEVSLISAPGHHLLLGDPGSGKTTLMKRFARQLLEPTSTDALETRTPVVILLGEHPESRSLIEAVVDILELPDVRDLGPEAIAIALDEMRAVLLVDGLDEIRPEHRPDIESDLVQLARLTQQSKIVVSCRSGDFNNHLEGFDVAEISALSEEQVKEIAEMWLGPRSAAFLSRAASSPARDLSDRPLFLCQMLLVFRNTESIPDQPASLVRQMVRLMLQDWDQQRRVARGSRYSGFDTDAKVEFLSNIAFITTFARHSSRFTHNDMVDAYRAINERFRLPDNEGEQVAQEIETHTGIIVRAGHDAFEFSHLSIQEYLAADYVVRLADGSQLSRLFSLSPATLAVAVALSTDPSRFLMRIAELPTLSKHPHELRTFILRLVQERPRFVVEHTLGVAVLRLLLAGVLGADDDSLLALLDYPGVGSAVASALTEDFRWTLAPAGTQGSAIHLRPNTSLSDGGSQLPEGWLTSPAVVERIEQMLRRDRGNDSPWPPPAHIG